MTTDAFRRRPGRVAGLVTMGVVSMSSAALVAWAAATPVTTAASTPAAPSGPSAAELARTARQIAAARSELEDVRRGLPRLITEEDDLPRVSLKGIPSIPAPSTTVQVPSGAAPQVITQVAPPPVAATTGASGAARP